MAKLYITEHTGPGTWGGNLFPAAKVPALATQVLNITAGSVQSQPFQQDSYMISVHTDMTCSIEFGYDPAATTNSKRMVANSTEYFQVQPNHKIAVVANS
jgi:hypothetical protein